MKLFRGISSYVAKLVDEVSESEQNSDICNRARAVHSAVGPGGMACAADIGCKQTECCQGRSRERITLLAVGVDSWSRFAPQWKAVLKLDFGLTWPYCRNFDDGPAARALGLPPQMDVNGSRAGLLSSLLSGFLVKSAPDLGADPPGNGQRRLSEPSSCPVDSGSRGLAPSPGAFCCTSMPWFARNTRASTEGSGIFRRVSFG